jgi:hypothetical protein
MRITRLLLLVGVCGFVLAAALLAPLRAQQGAAAGVTVDADDIGGVVTSANGPEAGVWVIAETDDLSTPLKKIVVTDDEGRYLLPDMPEATYRVWVRGYGLVDSEPVNGAPGDTVALTAVLAPDAQAAAQYYPANYWYSLLEVPEASEFPQIGEAIGRLAGRVTAAEMRRMNYAVDAERRDPAAVAREFLDALEQN